MERSGAIEKIKKEFFSNKFFILINISYFLDFFVFQELIYKIKNSKKVF